MKLVIGLLCVVALLSASGTAFADADDVKWINQCIKDNKDEGAKAAVVRKYCECMNSKMDASETRSITQWEKTHKKERDDCSKQAGCN
jgi:hypothetical protein